MANQETVRDARGRFTKGTAPGPGRPGKRSLVEALRDQADPEVLAAMLLKRAQKSDLLLKYVYDRLEGMPKQEVAAEHTGSVDIALRWDDGSEA